MPLLEWFRTGEVESDLGPREQVGLLDYDPLTDDGGGWMATLPLSAIYEHGADVSRMTVDMHDARMRGAAGGGVLGALVLVIASVFIPGITITDVGVPALIIGGLGGTILGWVKGPAIAPKPISIYRREWRLCAPEEIGLVCKQDHEDHVCHVGDEFDSYEGGPCLFIAIDGPASSVVTHEQIRETDKGFWHFSVYPVPYTNMRGEDDPSIDEVMITPDLGVLVGTEDKAQVALPFDPALIRASYMWEVLQQKIDKMQWGMLHVQTTWQKLEVTGAVVVALGVVGAVIFLMIATAPPPTAGG